MSLIQIFHYGMERFPKVLKVNIRKTLEIKPKKRELNIVSAAAKQSTVEQEKKTTLKWTS